MRINEDDSFLSHQKRPITSNYTERTHYVTVPPGGRRKGEIGRMDEDDIGKVTRPKKNNTINITFLPV
jgi:hypothetical protein